MAVISKGIKLFRTTAGGVDRKELTNLMEIPDLGGDAEAIEITTLMDEAHMYTNGIKNYGDSLAFKFLYETAQFQELEAITGESEWIVGLPDNSGCTFNGTSSVKLDAVGVNAALTYTLSIKPTSKIDWTESLK